MTPSPEERARELSEKLADEAVSGHPEEGYDFIEALAEPIIAAALRAAENDALERAAKHFDNLSVLGPSSIATAIRALKTSA